ncbi:MAG: hypothetical protein K2O39_02160, partial [Clostridiales bacterium]|nr:hypothetical protein [Clostridiales bacterium]
LNYYVLTSGEVNYESYERRSEEVISEQISGLPKEFEWCGPAAQKPKDLIKYIDSKTQINVINEAALSSHSLVLARNKHLNELGDRAFELESAPDEHGAYRVAVIGFGKTGQYAMEELYIHTARLDKKSDGYVPTQFIADVYDDDINKKSGLFAYNHPLFRCLDEKNNPISDTSATMARAKNITGEGIEILRSEYMEQAKAEQTKAQKFIDSKMAFPVAVMHKGNCFAYPFLAAEGTETAIAAVRDYGIRDIVVALGNDERNIDMTNILIDSFRRLFLKEELADEKSDLKLKLPHVKIYVNIIDKRNKALIDWRWEKDEALLTHKYECNANGEITDYPRLSVIPFGYREKMYSYSPFIEDYRERLYNYGYNLRTAINDANEQDKPLVQQNYDQFKASVAKDYNAYKSNEDAIDQWMTISQFLRLSNKSAQAFSINYYKYKKLHAGEFSAADWDYLVRLEHERWNRFFISHGWVYAKYYKDDKYKTMSDEDKKEEKKKEKDARRQVRQHNCLCPFDVMLDDYTKAYDRGNVELGFIKEIVFGE